MGMRRRQIDDSIIERYLNGESLMSIKRSLKTNFYIVRDKLVSSGVTIRDSKEVTKMRCHKCFNENDRILEIIDGLILGDASIEWDTKSEGRLELSQKRLGIEWLEMIKKEFDESGIISSITDRGDRGFQLRTRKYVNFTKQRQRWYINGKKMVPNDVRLTALSLANWYWGDGCCCNRGYRAMISTDGFIYDDVLFLCNRLNKIYGWDVFPIRHVDNYVIYIQRYKDRTDLYNLIKPFCPDCFNYKMKLKINLKDGGRK